MLQSNELALYTIPYIKCLKIFKSLFFVLFSWKTGWENSEMVWRIYC